MIPDRAPHGEPDLHANITAASPAVRHDTVGCYRREANVTAASLIILVPWLVFAAGLAAIGLRLLVIRRDRRRR